MKRVNFRKLGFTLLELTVTTSVMVILASVVALSLVNAQRNSRDGRRLSDLDTYVNAMTQYTATTGRTFIKSGNCTVTYIDGGLSYGYSLTDGCVGADGTSYGKLNLVDATVSTVVRDRIYPSTSIAGALEKGGYLGTVAKDPKNKVLANNNPVAPDYVIMRCCLDGRQSQISEGNAFAIWAVLEREPNPTEKSNSGAYCGSQALRPDPTTVYDLGINESERADFDARGVARGNTAIAKMTDPSMCPAGPVAMR